MSFQTEPGSGSNTRLWVDNLDRILPLLLNSIYYKLISGWNKIASTVLGGLASQMRTIKVSSAHHWTIYGEHLRTTWSRPEISHLLPEACSHNGTDNRQKRQRRTERHLPVPSNIIVKRFCFILLQMMLFHEKVSKLYCLVSPLRHSVFFMRR